MAILGAGGGMDVLQALYQDAGEIHAVELNPQVAELVSRDYAEFSGGLYANPKVQLHTAEGRGFVSARDTRYDLIQLALQDSAGASSAGLYALSESYLYTVEAMRDYLDDNVRPRIERVPGVAEVATVGGMVKQYQVVLDPEALRIFSLPIAEVRRALARRGHLLAPRDPMGNVQLVLRDRETGRWTGASDPRGIGAAAVEAVD